MMIALLVILGFITAAFLIAVIMLLQVGELKPTDTRPQDVPCKACPYILHKDEEPKP